MKTSTMFALVGSILVGPVWAQDAAAGRALDPNFSREFFLEGRSIGNDLDGLITIKLPRQWAARARVKLPSDVSFGIVAACPKEVVPENCLPPKALGEAWKTLDFSARGGLALTADFKSLARGYDDICTPSAPSYDRLQGVESRLATWSSRIYRVSGKRIYVIPPRSGTDWRRISVPAPPPPPGAESSSTSRPASEWGPSQFRQLSRKQRSMARSAIEIIMPPCGAGPNEPQYEGVVWNACSLAKCDSPTMNCSLASCCDTWPSHCPQEGAVPR
jgi:hypothetical protein